MHHDVLRMLLVGCGDSSAVVHNFLFSDHSLITDSHDIFSGLGMVLLRDHRFGVVPTVFDVLVNAPAHGAEEQHDQYF